MEKTTDFLLDMSLSIKQRKDMFRINTDTFALACFMVIKKGETVLDIGTNNGALLLVAAQYQPKKLIGVDILGEAIALAHENMSDHGIDNVELTVSDVRNFKTDPVDVILCNPPYFNQKNRKNRNQNPFLEAARHEVSLPLHDLLDFVRRTLKDHGRFYLIHRSDRMAEIIIESHNRGLALKKCMPIQDQRKDYCHAICMEFVRGGKCGLKLMNPLIISKEGHHVRNMD